MSIKRVISGLIGFPIVALVLIFGNQIVIDIAFAIIAAMSFHEYSHAFKVSDKAKPLTWLGYLACVTIALIHVFPREYLMLIIGAVVPIAILLCFAQILITKMKTTIIDAAVTLFGICYIVIFLMFMPIIRTAENGVFLIWYVMFASWGTDIFAYVCGKLIGKHKFSKISPNKTIEGCVGGTIGAVIMILIYTTIINNLCGMNINYVLVAGIGLILSLLSQMGDFAASSIKRFTGIKDYSNLIPGHGGMLDRIDSIIFIAPFAYFLLVLI